MKQLLFQHHIMWNYKKLVEITKEFYRNDHEDEEFPEEQYMIILEQWELWRAFNCDQ